MIILDTNVLSEFMLRSPNPRIVAWLNRQPRMSIWTTSVTIFEVLFGLHSMAVGNRRGVLSERFEEFLAQINQQIIPFDADAAQHASVLMASRKSQGRPREFRDTMIAGIVLAHNATLATRNVSHFGDIPGRLVDPWNDGA
jgi:hypothetical protein